MIATDDEYTGITPHITVRDAVGAVGAVSFSRAAFGADELIRNTGDDGRVLHSELLLNGGRLLLHDDFSAAGESAEALGGAPVTLHRYVADHEDLADRWSGQQEGSGR